MMIRILAVSIAANIKKKFHKLLYDFAARWEKQMKNYTYIIKIKQPTEKILEMRKSSCLKWTYGRSSIDYIVASLFTG